MTGPGSAGAVVEHHLRLFGFDVVAARLQVLLEEPAPRGTTVVLQPSRAACRALGLERRGPQAAPAILRVPGAPLPRGRLRTLHPYHLLDGPGEPVVVDGEGHPVWVWRPRDEGGVLLVGTDVAADLIRYRQGDPAGVTTGRADTLWDIPGERPLYLFEPQLAGEAPDERHADWWAMTLATALARATGISLGPVLPGNAAGAVVVTGDDDQAALDCYAEQRAALGDIPITYFLHPRTKHTAVTLAELGRRAPVDLGLHPDALDAPGDYAERFAAQARWFRRLVGRPAISVRNHGFLNDGYWGHLPAWRRAGVRLSANLPGVDGRVLNGSLLPARMVWDDELTEHWSILTAVGDGARFALGRSDDEAAQCILRLGQQIETSGVPGVIVLNLHPENVRATQAMHRAARTLVDRGFQPWTVAECLDWFERRDGRPAAAPRQPFWARLVAGRRA